MKGYRQRRSRHACKWCHQQRVRCDVSRTGVPCTRCAQDGESCEIWTKESSIGNDCGKHHIQKSWNGSPRHRIGSDGRKKVEGRTSPSVAGLFGHVEFSEYSFLRLSPSCSLGKEEMLYFAQKGCLHIPARPALDTLVRAYFMHVHPYSPILDEASFWNAYRQRSLAPSEPISLFVFQAMLFVCCTYVGLEVVQQCGFSNKLTARKEFFTRAKLLLDLGGENQDLDKARGALLLSHQALSDNPQIGSIMLGNAIQCYMISETSVNEPSTGLKSLQSRRVWWSIVLRDAFISLAFRRHTQINWSDPNLRAEFLNERDLEDEIKSSEVYDESTKHFLVEVFKKQCKLAVLVIEMMSAVFPRQHCYICGSTDDLTRHMQEIQDIKNAFTLWEEESGAIIHPEPCKWPDSVISLINMTRAYYFTARIHLIHCEMAIYETNRPIFGEIHIIQIHDSAPELKHAVSEVHQVMIYMGDNQKKEMIPLSMLALMAWPLAVAAIDVNLARTTEESMNRTQRMSCLGEIYRYLTEVADVTSFVTSGAKQILLLANTAVQQIIPKYQTPSPSSMSDRQFYEIGSVSYESYSRGYAADNLHDWADVFVHYPSVYLLISKATDYALSCGRLPDQDKLPACLRSLNILSAIGTDLPWFRSHSSNDFKGAPLDHDLELWKPVVAEDYGVKGFQMPEIPQSVYLESFNPTNYLSWPLEVIPISREGNDQNIFQEPGLNTIEWDQCDGLNVHDAFCELDPWLWNNTGHNTGHNTGLQSEFLC